MVSENGDHIVGASEDALFEMIGELDDTDNTFIVIEPGRSRGSRPDGASTSRTPPDTARPLGDFTMMGMLNGRVRSRSVWK
ncbi:hypothetical protein ACH4D5_24295 [Streptomyces sp. NPDC018029]|uniref:hypothetical protein n=1 Tax=Streptomyces sp. NPDC018029 TaxID=3365032 RepID=UPI0037A742ED